MKKNERQRFLSNSLKILRSYHAAMGGEQSEKLNEEFIRVAMKIITHKEQSINNKIIKFPKVFKKGVRSHETNKHKNNNDDNNNNCFCALGNKYVVFYFG